MRDNKVLTVFVILLTISVIFFGFAIVTSADRYRFALEELKKELQTAQERPVFLKNDGKMTEPEAAQVKGANAEYYALSPLKNDGKMTGPAAAQIKGANAEYYDPSAVSGDRMITAIGADVGNLNPLTNQEATVSALWSLANSSLTERNFANPELFEPLMAESWSISKDRMVWRIRLRGGIYWHDFTDPVTKKEWKKVPVTSADFKFYVDTVQNPDVDAAPLRGYLSGIKEIRIFNDREFDVVWKEPYFLARDITLGLSPLPRHLYHAYDGKFDGKKFNDDNVRNRMIVGCGPYRLLKWEKGKRIVFERFENYFGRSLGIMPPIRKYVFEIIQHPSTRLQALVSGDIDQNNITPEQWLNNTGLPAYREGGTLKKIKYPSLTYNYIGLNLKNPLFHDRKVRVALSHLINRNRLLTDVYRDLARAVSGGFFMDSPAYDKTILPYPFDIEKAKRLLAEAGWKDTDGDGILDKDGQPFRFTLMFPSVNPNYVKLAPILKEDFAKAGVQLELLSLEWTVVIQRLEQRKFDAAMMGWTTPLTGDPYQLWHSDQLKNPGSSNFISFSNPEADRLIELIRTTPDDQERLNACHLFHRLIHEEQPYLFLFSPYNLQVISSRYRNLKVFPAGVPDQILWTPRNEQKSVPGL